MKKKEICVYIYLGLIDYLTAWELQKRFAEKRRFNLIPDVLLLLQHPHTITIGKSGKRENLLVSPEFLRQKKVRLIDVDRGGDITYHGPGQLVGYPILDLSGLKPDVIWYLRQLEEVIIGMLDDYQIDSGRRPKYTGVWVDEEKIAAIGVKMSRWITSHGFALNINTDLSYFDLIVPCGIRHKNVTSLSKITGKKMPVQSVVPRIVNNFSQVFNFRMIPYNHATWPEINEVLELLEEKRVVSV